MDLTKENVELLREFPGESVRYIEANFEKITTHPGQLIQDVVNHVLSVKGKQILETSMLEGM